MLRVDYVMLGLLMLVAMVAGGAPSCTPSHIALTDSAISFTTSDPSYKTGDIHYRDCSHTPMVQSRKTIGWCPSPTDKQFRLQVDLPRPMAVYGIVFQMTLAECPRANPDFSFNSFMQTFDLQYVIPGDHQGILVTYAKDLTALDGVNYEKTLTFQQPLVTRTMSIVPKMYNMWPCFRFKLIGCEPDSMCPANWCLNGGVCAGDKFCSCSAGFYGERCNMTANSIKQSNYGFQRIESNQLITPDATFDVVGDVTVDQNSRRRRDHHHGHHDHHQCHFHSHHDHHHHDDHHHHPEDHHHPHCQYHHGNNHHDHHEMHHLHEHHHGFTTSMHLNLGHNHHGHCHLYSNGGNVPGHNGACLSYDSTNSQMHFRVQSTTHTWSVTHPCTLKPDTTHTISTSWHPQTGVQVFVNNQHIVSSNVATTNPTPCTNTKPLRLLNGHVTVDINLNINLTMSQLNMYPCSKTTLTNLGIPGPLGITNPTTTPAPTTTPTPTTTPSTTTASTTPAVASASTTNLYTKPTTQPSTTTMPNSPMCFSYKGQSTIGVSNYPTTRCKVGEVCNLFQDVTGYTAQCLPRDVCDTGKRIAVGACWECCDSYLCNDNCAASASGPCVDKAGCATMVASGYDVCNDKKMAVDLCSKTCKVC